MESAAITSAGTPGVVKIIIWGLHSLEGLGTHTFMGDLNINMPAFVFALIHLLPPSLSHSISLSVYLLLTLSLFRFINLLLTRQYEQ